MTHCFTRALLRAGVLVTMAFSAAPALAGDYWCTTQVVQLGMQDNNNIWLRTDAANGSRWLYICSLSDGAANPSQAGCQAWYATLLQAKATNKPVEMHFVGSLSATSCATHPGWNAADRPIWLVMWP